jgi:hypothetical protein
LDASRLDSVARFMAGPASRRTLLGLVCGGRFTRFAVAEAKKQHKKHCGPCKKRKKGKCKPKPNGTPCGNGSTCQGGKCHEPPPDSTCAETCDGCCAGMTCAPGDADGACGQSGETCEDCTPDGACCGGTCCDGCCFDGQCYPGNDIELCGSGGVACAECLIEEICTVDRVCAPPTCGNGGPCVVFVTSVEGEGDFGGLAGADEICQFLAEENGLPGAYKAWLSDDTGSPSTRFMRSPGAYQLVNETVIADDWADLTDGWLQAAIDRNEEGERVFPLEVWTNTTASGLLDQSDADCTNWTADEFASGRFGVALATNLNWTEFDNEKACEGIAGLYCFQQS